MSPWHCAFVIGLAGASGGFVNALISDNGFALPRKINGVLCPGALSTIVAGAFAAFASWAFYGSGAGIDVADANVKTGLQFSAIAGAFMIGVVGAKWITNEADKRLLKESVRIAATKTVTPEQSEKLAQGSPLEVLQNISEA